MAADRRNYDSADTVEENGVLFCLRRDRREAFAGGYQWDGSGDAIEYSIPDTVQGVKVTAIGGWTGGLKKVPAAGPDGTHAGDVPGRGADAVHPAHRRGGGDAAGTHPHRPLCPQRPAGRRLPAVTCYFDHAKGTGSYLITQVWTVTCDEGNETYYARDGRLYQRADNALVQLPYGTE